MYLDQWNPIARWSKLNILLVSSKLPSRCLGRVFRPMRPCENMFLSTAVALVTEILKCPYVMVRYRAVSSAATMAVSFHTLCTALKICLGLPRHRQMCADFITKAMRKPVARHDRLLRLAKNIVVEAPLTALRLLQLCGVKRFEHVISAVPPAIICMFAEARDATVVQCLEAIY